MGAEQNQAIFRLAQGSTRRVRPAEMAGIS